MAKMTVHFEVLDEYSEHWASRGIIITAVSEVELQSFYSLLLTHQHLELIKRTLSTSVEYLETKGATTTNILKLIADLREPTRLATEQIAYLVQVLQHSVSLSKPVEKEGRLQ